MVYKVDTTLEDFNAWSGGKETLDTLIEKGDVEKVEELIDETFTDAPTETEINDFLWFERDAIADYLGFEDWDAYEIGGYTDCNGVKLDISDEVYWYDEAGSDENGNMITFTIVDEDGQGYFNLANEGEEYPERWAYHNELMIV